MVQDITVVNFNKSTRTTSHVCPLNLFVASGGKNPVHYQKLPVAPVRAYLLLVHNHNMYCEYNAKNCSISIV